MIAFIAQALAAFSVALSQSPPIALPSTVVEVQVAPTPTPVARKQPATPVRVAASSVPLTVVVAGTDGAFAYCDQGMLAYNPCSEAYYAPAAAIPTQGQVTLADGLRYWTVTLLSPGGAPVPPCPCVVTPPVPYLAYVPVSETAVR